MTRTVTLTRGPLNFGKGWLEVRRQRHEHESGIIVYNLRPLHQAGVSIAAGTDAGNPLTLHGPAIFAESEAMQAAEMSPMAVIVAATRNGARAMDRGDEFGTVEEDKIAGLLVLAADPTETVAHFRDLLYVMRAGELSRQQALRSSP